MTAARALRAQQKAMPVIGWLGFSTGTDINARPGLLQGLRELGYIEGQNIRVEYRFSGESGVSFAGPIEDLARLKVNIIVPVGFPATDAVHRAALTISVVFVVADPIGSGFRGEPCPSRRQHDGTCRSPSRSNLAGNGWSCSRRRRHRCPGSPILEFREPQ